MHLLYNFVWSRKLAMKTGKFTLKQTVAMFQAMGDGDDSEISSLSDSDDNEETYVGCNRRQTTTKIIQRIKTKIQRQRT